MTLGHGGWGGLCPGGQSRVCAHVAHIAYVYSRCVPPVASLPTRHLVFPRTPFSLSRPPAPPCVICPPCRVPHAVFSAPPFRRPPPRRPPACQPSCCPPAPPSLPPQPCR